MANTNKGALDLVALVLVVIGGLNWGLIGLGGFIGSNWNVVAMILGSVPWLLNLVYLLVGLSAVWMAYKATQ